jgi:hypothetical protein
MESKGEGPAVTPLPYNAEEVGFNSAINEAQRKGDVDAIKVLYRERARRERARPPERVVPKDRLDKALALLGIPAEDLAGDELASRVRELLKDPSAVHKKRIAADGGQVNEVVGRCFSCLDAGCP